jgi:tRNA threonylcarbamoyladenosine biosynthesis protein TsaE
MSERPNRHVVTCTTKGVDETRALASAVAELARPGDVLVLSGELGAGKTAFAPGFAAGLGVTEQVTSPTFTLARPYQGRLTMHHLDVYRLDHLQEAVDLGLAELVDDGAVTLVEWGEVVLPALPGDRLDIRLLHSEDDDVRTVLLQPSGGTWARRADALAGVLSRWSD